MEVIQLDKDESTKYFPALTGARAMAAYFVFLHHFCDKTFVFSGVSLFEEFHIGVSIFFVLSGFLITHRYYKNTNFSFLKYIFNRFSRIYPLFFLITSLSFSYNYFFEGKNSADYLLLYLGNILFLKGFFKDLIFTGISQGWTLTVEECFYFAAPFFYFFIRKNKSLVYFLPFLIFFTGIIIVYFAQNINFYGFMTNLNFMSLYTFFGRCTEFFVGIFLAIHMNKIPQFSKITFVGFAGILVSIFGLMFFQTSENAGVFHPFGIFINNIFLPIFGIFPFFVGLLTEKTFFTSVFESKIGQLLGKSSYAFYLIHQGYWIRPLYNWLDNNFLYFIIVNIFAIVLYKFIEQPLNLWLRKTFFN